MSINACKRMISYASRGVGGRHEPTGGSDKNVNIDASYIYNMFYYQQRERCFYTGRHIDLNEIFARRTLPESEYGKTWIENNLDRTGVPSIDRILNSIDYEPGNIVITTGWQNCARNTTDFIVWININRNEYARFIDAAHIEMQNRIIDAVVRGATIPIIKNPYVSPLFEYV
jgi:hypothetical protein